MLQVYPTVLQNRLVFVTFISILQDDNDKLLI